MIDFGMDPQAALDALRFGVQLDGRVALEEGLPATTFEELQKRGHDVFSAEGYQRTLLGVGQVIERDAHTGVLRGGSEPRRDGYAIGW